MSSLGLDTPMGFFLRRLCLNGIVSEQVSHPTLCLSSEFLTGIAEEE